MSRPRRSLLRRYRLFAPRLFRQGLLLLALLLLCDGLAAFYFPQLQAALSLKASAGQPQSSASALAPVRNDPAAVALASDTFRRPNGTYWGISSDGQLWQADANSLSYFAIANHEGVINAPARPVTCEAILGPTEANMDITLSASLSRYGPSVLGVVLRWSDPGDFYTLYLDGQNLVLARVMDGMLVPLHMVAFPARAGALYTFRFRAVGPRLFAMVWPTGQPALSDWQIAWTDGALSAGRAGLRVLTQNSVQVKVTAFTEVQL